MYGNQMPNQIPQTWKLKPTNIIYYRWFKAFLSVKSLKILFLKPNHMWHGILLVVDWTGEWKYSACIDELHVFKCTFLYIPIPYIFFYLLQYQF